MRFLFTALFCLIIFFRADTISAADSFTPEQMESELMKLLELDRDGFPKTIAGYAYQQQQDCLTKKNPAVMGKALERFCRCTSMQISKVMTHEQMDAIAKNTGDAIFQKERLITLVYAPCVPPAVKKNIWDICITSVRNEYMMKNIRATCKCISEGVAENMDEYNNQIIETKTKQNELAGEDPYELLLDPRVYSQRSTYQNKTCINIHERRVGQ